MKVIPTATLDVSNFSVELLGRDHGYPGASLILVDAEPGRGPALPRGLRPLTVGWRRLNPRLRRRS